MRIDPLANRQPPEQVTFSGGVSEYIYGREAAAYGDLGPLLGAAIRKRIEGWKGVRIEMPEQGIRATVVGASQYTVQVSGSTIFVTPASTSAVAHVPAITPDLPLAPETLDPAAIASGDQGVAAQARSARGPAAGRDVLPLGRLGDVAAARRFLHGRVPGARGRARQAGIRWCWSATATSAASSASTRTRRRS